MSKATCPRCGGAFAEIDGPTHAYMESSPGCWACFGEVLAREYSDFQYQKVHRLTVDAYAVQHPGQPSPQSIQSVALHLISLCVIFEKGVDLGQATQIIQQAARDKARFDWLPPPSRGAWTIADVYGADSAQAHCQRVRQWAESAWLAWSAHHSTVHQWLDDLIAP